MGEMKYLLRGRCGGLGVSTLVTRDAGWLTGVEVLSQIEKTWVVLDHLKDLGLSVHHVIVLQDLLHCDYLVSCDYSCLQANMVSG